MGTGKPDAGGLFREVLVIAESGVGDLWSSHHAEIVPQRRRPAIVETIRHQHYQPFGELLRTLSAVLATLIVQETRWYDAYR